MSISAIAAINLASVGVYLTFTFNLLSGMNVTLAGLIEPAGIRRVKDKFSNFR
jgi:hypothetical protein